MRWWGKRGERSVAAGRDVGVAVTGDHNHLVFTRQVRSAYWEQVRRIAPGELVGRDRELAELTAFCTAGSGPAYAWWRAEAWAGKTALMKWFALNPPPGVCVVPFFVTAQLSTHNTFAAYADVVLEQLAELSGSMPAYLRPATRDAHLLRLYGEAARACRERGERLVLLVDGLDEDRGVTTGPDAHSIASLLPDQLEAGMRVLVTGRLNPPLPADVPDGHPLRDPSVARTLKPSPYARMVRAAAERELSALTEAGGLERELLTLVTAAGGGLTVEDLAALTGAVPFRVRKTLKTGAGRTFEKRAHGYLLAHEGLRRQAEEMVGDAELSRCRGLLHTWADAWRRREWPAETPAYLLRGYSQMVSRAGDTARMVEFALDQARHDRMLAVTGADGAALEEILTAERMLATAVADEAEPAAGSTGTSRFPHAVLHLLALCVHGDVIRGRRRSVTESLAWAWAALGRTSRAEALARDLPPLDKTPALARVAEELAGQGDTERATGLAVAAEEALHESGFGLGRPEHAVAVHRAFVRVGLYDRAEAVLRSASVPLSSAALAAQVVETWLDDEEFDRARAEVTRQTAPSHRSACIRALVTGLLAQGRTEQAWEIVREAGDSAPSGALCRLALALAEAGRVEEAERLLNDARDHATTFKDRLQDPKDCLEELSEAGADATDYFQAFVDARRWDVITEMLRNTARDGDSALWLATFLAPVLVLEGKLDSAEALLAGRTEGTAVEGARLLAAALARRGESGRVRRFCRTFSSTAVRSELSAAAAEGFAATGRLREAESLAVWSDPAHGLDPLARGAVAWARSGHREEAAAFLARVENRVRAEAGISGAVSDRARVAQALAAAGHTPAARELLAGIENALAQTAVPRSAGSDTPWHGQELTDVALALVRSGELDRAEALIRSPDGAGRGAHEAWAALLRAWTGAGRYGRAEKFVAEAPTAYRDGLLAEMSVVWAERGEAARSVDCAGTVREAPARISATARAAAALALSGMRTEARTVLAELPQHNGCPDLGKAPESALVLADVFQAWSVLGEPDRARAVAGEALRLRNVTGYSVGWRLVRALVRARLCEEARWWVRQVPPGDEHDSVREALVVALAEAGDVSAALNWARPLGEHPEAAVALVSRVAPDRARSLAIHALRHGEWQEALPAVLHVEPAAVPFLVGAFRHAPTAARTSAPSWTTPPPASPAAPASPPPSAPCTSGPGSTPSSPGPDR
ncbi:tetratricopeptide (TPR) repeat protein [Streptomyces africanus]|uniref:Tetratricopeptide (TPR) repeat protein n=1 Tax=Streptomyces africanus TaxID=231024 RepID=A0ABU0QTH7_9ACTN|nr:tetratricopeptide (TPR) repeat protein [Streptomyces africanus]